MTDRELLEKAALAADCEYYPESAWPWNPLEDDGQALRLAVMLMLEVDVCLTGIAVRTPIGHKVLIDSKQEPDVYAATRRAIVRAAAAIGEAL